MTIEQKKLVESIDRLEDELARHFKRGEAPLFIRKAVMDVEEAMTKAGLSPLLPSYRVR